MQSLTLSPILVISLLCLVVPAAAIGEPGASIYALPADTSGPAPFPVTVYINESQAAVAEGNWTGAILVTTRGVKWYPEDAELFCLQGYSLRKVGEYQQAVDAVSRAIRLDPRAVRYANRAYAYLALKNYSAALDDAEAGLRLDDSYTTNYAVKALALQGLYRNTEALVAAGTAVERSPGSAHYWHVKGRVLATAGDCSGAAAALEQSVAIDPTYQLPYPSFGSAQESLSALNATCNPQGSPAPTRSPLGLIAAAGCMGAVILFGTRK